MQVVTSQSIRRRGEWSEPDGSVLLTYEERFLRRKMLTTLHCEDFLVDLAQTTSLDGGDAFELGDGRLIEVVAANEPLLAITSDNLTRLAWHIGNRHTPCQVEGDRLLIRQDHVIRDMLERLGASVSEVNAPFAPEGGAYGHGRTHGHSHGHAHANGH